MNGSDGVVLDQYPVEIEHRGRIVGGVYSTWAGRMTVTAASEAIETTDIGGTRSNLSARIILRELAHAGRA